jgi:hypothetical protein
MSSVLDYLIVGRVMLDWSVPQMCIDCGGEMRKPKSEHDTRRPHYSGGRCSHCYYLNRSADTTRRYDWEKDRFCADCKKKMRPNKQPADGDTVKHYSNGVCETCHERSRRHRNGARPRTPLTYDDKGQVCKYCLRYLVFENFPATNHNPTGRRSKCYKCQSLWSAYRIRYSDFKSMFVDQGGACGACKKSVDESSVYVDHDHSCCPGELTCGRCVRGLLCLSCNVTLGHSKDSIFRLKQLIIYLENHGDHYAS